MNTPIREHVTEAYDIEHSHRNSPLAHQIESRDPCANVYTGW